MTVMMHTTLTRKNEQHLQPCSIEVDGTQQGYETLGHEDNQSRGFCESSLSTLLIDPTQVGTAIQPGTDF